MGKLLYEAGFRLEFGQLIPFILLIIIFLFPRIMRKYVEATNVTVNMRYVHIFCRYAFVFVLVLALVTTSFQINMYNKTVGAYRKGDYKIAEGYVENFVPMPYEGRGNEESFEINGVKFSYSDYSIQSGYHNSKSHGGVIQGNGQHLRIGYVYYNEIYGNVIVYIEQLP